LQYADTYLKSLNISFPNQKLSPSMTVSMTESEVEAYIYDSIPHIPLLTAANLHDTFIPFYVFTAVRRIFFFLDSLRTKKITIHKLSHSQEMDEFLWLQRLDQYREDYATQRAYQKEIDSNWFSASNAIRLYETYVASDRDGNGMLNQVLNSFLTFELKRCADGVDSIQRSSKARETKRFTWTRTWIQRNDVDTISSFENIPRKCHLSGSCVFILFSFSSLSLLRWISDHFSISFLRLNIVIVLKA
jgi:hypothetical protein